MDSKDQHDNKASRQQLTTSREQREGEDGIHSDCHTTSQHVCQSASQHGHNTSRKRNLDVRTQHPDTSSQHNHDAQLRDAVSDGRWWDVPDLITIDVSGACRAWAVEEACRYAFPMFVESHIIPRCTENQLRSLLHVLVRRGLWRAVCQSLDLGVSDEQCRFAVETVSEAADEASVLLLLPFCPDDLLDTVLVQVTRRGLWRAAIAVLQRGVSDTEKKWAVQTVREAADEASVLLLLPFCPDDLLDTVLVQVTRRGLWRAAIAVLQRGVSDTEKKWAVQTVSEAADEASVLLLLPYCPDDLLDTVLVQVTRRGLWRAAIAVLQRGVSDTEKKWAVQTVSEAADEASVLLLLPCCPDDLLDTLLVQVTRRGLWRAVIAVLQRGVGDTERKWAVQAACDRADEHHLTHGILGHCHDDQMDSVLTRLVERSLWGAARWLLVQSRDDETVPGISTGTLTELTEATDDKLFPCIATGTDAPCIQTSDAKLSPVGSVGIYNQDTQAVDDISSPDACTATHTHCSAPTEDTGCNGEMTDACTATHTHYLTPAEDTDCNGEMNDACTVLTQAVERRLWCTVSAVLRYISNDGDTCRDIQRLAVEEACKHADDRHLSEIATACGENQLDVVLKESTRRGLWKTVCSVFQRGSHRAQTDTAVTQRWGVGRVGKNTDSDCVGRNPGEVIIQLDGILNINTADTCQVIIAEDIADTFQVFLVETIAGRMMEGYCVNVIGFSTVAKCAAVLQEAVRRGLCERPDVDTDDDDDDNTDDGDDDADNDNDNTDVGDDGRDNESLRYHGVYPVIKGTRADLGRNGLMYIRCARDRPADLLLIKKGVTVRPGMREPVCNLLTITDYISSSDTERRAVEEACKRADDEEFVSIVDVCAVDQLNTMLTEAVRRGMWKTVIWLLARIRITDTRDTHRITVEEACTRTEDGGFVAVIRFSTQAQRYAAMTEAVTRMLCKMINNDSEACERTDDGECVTVRFSTQAQRDAVMTEAVRRGLCKRIDDDSGASDTQRWTVRTGMWNIGTLNVWEIFCTLLQTVNDNAHNTSDTERWAVEEACKRADDGECKYIVDFCDENQFNTVLTGAVRRGLWKTVVRLLAKLQDTQFLLHPVICSGVSDKRRWAVEEAFKCSNDADSKHIFQFCDKEQLDTVLTEAVRRGLWKTVTRLLYRIRREHVSNANYARRRAVEEASKRAGDYDFNEIVHFCDADQHEPLLTQAVTRGLWNIVELLLHDEYTISDTARRRAVDEANNRATVFNFYHITNRVKYKHPGLVARLLWKRKQHSWAFDVVKEKFGDVNSDGALDVWAELFVDSLSDECADSSVQKLELTKDLDSIVGITDTSIEIVRNIVLREKRRKLLSTAKWKRLFSQIHSVPTETSLQSTDVYPHFFKWCVQRRGGTTSLCQLSLPLIATQTVNPALQSLARTSMWEETRRWYLQFLVEEKLWAVVKEVADHSVYDDQRAWALEQARHHKQWDVVVHLADHGLTENHRWRVYRQVAKYADWDAVRLLFKRGVDMRRVCEELMAANPSRERPPDNEADIERRRNRGEDVSKLEAEYRERSECVARLALEHKQRCRELDTLEKRQAGRRTDGKMSWYAVLSQLRQDVTEEGIEMTLQHAIQSEAWTVVVQLVRLGMDAAQRDRLFPETIRRRQWGVARALLEQGVSVELSRATLPQLMETDQWILVARVMELSLDDTDRRRVMQAALDKKEGSVVAHGISVMEGRLSVEERQAMYDQALSQGMWQAVRRLVEKKDSTGIVQRDEALVAAVDNHRWDIVEHCVAQGADLNKQKTDGNTMLHEKAKGDDWDSVDGLVHCGADPNMTDMRGYSAFHTAVHTAVNSYDDDALSAVTTSVKFHGNLNRPDPEGHIPLYKLINCLYPREVAEILDEALWWGSDVAQGQRADSRGRTVLHVMCETGRWKSLQYVLARGVHPLAVTKDGDTALAVAVMYAEDQYKEQYREDEGIIKWEAESAVCRQKLVAECIKLGISTHQPPITDSKTDIRRSPVYISISRPPFHFNIWTEDRVVLHMLYESGACSHRELLAVLDQPPRPPNPDNWRYTNNKDLYKKDKSRHNQCRSYLKQLVTTPRNLQSTCRLVISHHLGICKPRTRQKRVKQLRLPDRMKDYVLFSDLTDPDKVKDIEAQLSCADDSE